MFNVGDKVTRMMGGSIPMELTVTAVTEDRIICGPWEFDKRTGAEIDEDFGWGPGFSGSYIQVPGVTYISLEK
jgi:hypothetical protein